MNALLQNQTQQIQSSNKDLMSETKKQPIQPDAFTANGTSAEPKQKAPAPDKDNSNFLVLAIVGSLVVLAAAVLIVPALIPDTNISDTLAVSSETLPKEITPPLSTPNETPWADAQLLKARREAQEILAELLTVQNKLESALVEVWAKDRFDQVISFAAEGDILYTERQFDQSIELYQKALDLALELDIQVEDAALEYQQKGIDLLAENRIEESIASLEIAQQAYPNLTNISATLSRAKNREQVLRLIELSDIAASNPSTLETARQQIVDAQALDNQYLPLEEKRLVIEEKIVERNYREQMTAGYNALQKGQYDGANKAFQQAAQIKPNDIASAEALQQVEAQKLNTARQRALNVATKLEAEEQWQPALTQYNALLQEDSSLTAARLGKLRTEARFNLDKDIQSILESPLALQNQSKWETAQATLRDARGIINPGKQLQTQISQLESIIKMARTPITVKLQSDNQTEIEVYRVGQLGMFTEQAMNLNPGNYVIVGKRNGYQDVRIELALDGSNSEVTVPVICSVTI